MGRIARFVRNDSSTIYHIMSRTALDGFPLQDIEKDHLMAIVARLSNFYFVDLLGFCLMGNHFHLVVRMHTEEAATDEEIGKRYRKQFGDDAVIMPHQVQEYRRRLVNLGAFVKDIKQGFTRYFNKRRNRKGFFWGDRFKSVIVQEGTSLVNLLAYVDLNPVRAGIVDKPENYRWSGLGYLVQTGNRHGLLDMNLGMHEWNEFNPNEIIRKYRQFVYETGAMDTGKGKQMKKEVVEKERKKRYRLNRVDVFRHRCRYFTDSGIIGSKEFVTEVFDGVKHLLDSKDQRRFTPVGGVEGVYSMKRLPGAVGG
ncbi:REP element-mobilizing transposase RayT [Desulfonatronum thiosulfatophilum]|uniref:REP element-mobilizing transposase RayT n=1 Tax=Desulfonatronum thiosulfatophilum TaxID=617002 RepID=A0A1G6EEJ1_9BACT|nr:transposase [Desulfonatronum thiosulfatophilum]SDB55844.1 REP element-mobilizing transposase RayT [Desulfonatronum thiosulfatophilum]